MPKLGTITIDVWPRQQQAITDIFIEIVGRALIGHQKVAVILFGRISESDARFRLSRIVSSIGHLAAEEIILENHGIDLMCELPTPSRYDVIYVIGGDTELDWPRIVSYPLAEIEVRVLRVYDQEINRYV